MGLFGRKAKKGNEKLPPAVCPWPDSLLPGRSSALHLPSHTSPRFWHDHPTRPLPGCGEPPREWNQLLPPRPYAHQHAPIVINQNYYLLPPPVPADQRLDATSDVLHKLDFGSVVDRARDILPEMPLQLLDHRLPVWQDGPGTGLLNQSAALVDRITERFNEVITLIDQEQLTGDENALFTYQPEPVPALGRAAASATPQIHTEKSTKRPSAGGRSKGQMTAVDASTSLGSYFAKAELYANSRLPMNLPPLVLYLPTYPLLCLAAQYSERVYEKPKGPERNAHINADFRAGTKAMVIKSIPMDHLNTIVFAIRGTSTFMDWAVNLNMALSSPVSFLDDPGNLCHAGFLSVARKMIRPVAARLRQLLEEDPGRKSYSLLITGHSAGGAVASLLYCHMLSKSKAASSELNALTGCFRRVHCVTFGTPPISLLPLKKPDDPKFKKSLFLSFVNEGDPVARAGRDYLCSLLELLAAPAPPPALDTDASASTLLLPGVAHSPKEKKSKGTLASRKAGQASKNPYGLPSTNKAKQSMPVWKLPSSTLSNPGRIVVLRTGDPKARLKGRKTVEERLNDGVVAQVTTDEQLREVIWGDPVCHVMKLYAGRLEILAVGAVTAQGS